jgi:FecR protein
VSSGAGGAVSTDLQARACGSSASSTALWLDRLGFIRLRRRQRLRRRALDLAMAETGSSGQAGLRFLDASNLNVGPSSQVRLDKFVYDPNKGTGSVVIEGARGAFRFSSGGQNKGDIKIKTPSGTLGIRG